MTPPRDRSRPKKTMTLAQQHSRKVAELAAQGQGRNQIARSLDCSPATVTKAAAIAGASFDRSATTVATETVILAARDRRERLAGRLLDLADRCLDSIDLTELDAKALAVVAGIAVDKAVRLAELDSSAATEDRGAASAALDRLHDAIVAAGSALETPTENQTTPHLSGERHV